MKKLNLKSINGFADGVFAGEIAGIEIAQRITMRLGQENVGMASAIISELQIKKKSIRRELHAR